MGEAAVTPLYDEPEGLADNGSALWDRMGGSFMLDHSSRMLLHEACRTADRLERLDEILRGDTDAWLRVKLPRSDSDDDLVLIIDTALSEARQQQAILLRLLAAVVPVAAESGGEQPSGDILDEFDQLDEREGRPAPPSRART